ncbi:MAG TPA: hypothetical protein VN843_14020 [Anaerolineales bacterium]|nr:hypothetical protein [Anaerolineales bacterium]
MPEKFTWKMLNVKNKPNSREGHTARLLCYDKTTNEDLGWCYIEGWLYGCALMGLSNLDGLAGVPEEAFPSFKKFLKNTKVTLDGDAGSPHYHDYTAKRYMFTVSYAYGKFLDKLMTESEKIVEFENLAHKSAPNKMYFLTLGN